VTSADNRGETGWQPPFQRLRIGAWAARVRREGDAAAGSGEAGARGRRARPMLPGSC